MPLSRAGAGPDRSGSAGLVDAHTFRPGSSVAVGVVGLAAGALLVGPALVSAPRNWALISSVTLAMVLTWLFVLRPSATLHSEGVRIVNPMRTTDITWPMIEKIRSRWVLELFCQGRRYTAWGIPADPSRPRYGRDVFLLGANKVGAGRSVPAAGHRPKVEAQTVAAEIEARVAADRRRRDGATPRILSRSWDPTSVGLLLAGLAFFVIGVFVA